MLIAEQYTPAAWRITTTGHGCSWAEVGREGKAGRTLLELLVRTCLPSLARDSSSPYKSSSSCLCSFKLWLTHSLAAYPATYASSRARCLQGEGEGICWVIDLGLKRCALCCRCHSTYPLQLLITARVSVAHLQVSPRPFRPGTQNTLVSLPARDVWLWQTNDAGVRVLVPGDHGKKKIGSLLHVQQDPLK